MVYTSYFACKNKPPELKKISGALYKPRWFSIDDNAKELYPSRELLDGYKKGTIDKKEYTKIYKEQLSKLDPKEISKKYEDSIIYCYEKTTDFCHRHIFREWLNENGEECVELPNKLLKIAVIGSRTINDYNIIEEKLNAIRIINNFVLITGGENGVDKLAERYAKENDVAKVIFKPNKKDAKNANRIRNGKMVSAADIIIAFWDGVSKGTKSVLELAKNSKKEIIIVHLKDNNV